VTTFASQVDTALGRAVSLGLRIGISCRFDRNFDKFIAGGKAGFNADRRFRHFKLFRQQHD